MTVPGNLSSPLLATAAAASGAAGTTERSLRFNPGDNAYLNKTFSSAGNRRTFTYSYWVKECGKGSSPSNNPHVFWSGTGSSTRGGLVHRGTGSDANELYIFNQESGSTNCQVWTNSLHRDFSAWKHIVWSIDTTQSSSTNRVKLYINGVQETLYFATTPAQNLQLQININQEHRIGRGTPDDYGNFYLKDVFFIDGAALNATSFGAFDSNGVWQKAEYTGTFGTNGFHLAFNDTAALGADSSGNTNTFTANNFVATADSNSKGFKPVTYSGTGSSQSITSLAFQPDLIWIKSRSSAQKHVLVDSVRTTSTGEYLTSNSNQAEGTGVHISGTSDGFRIDDPNASTVWYNDSSHTYVAWCWKAGGTASSNSDGTITSSVSASTEYGFSVVTFAGPASAGFASVGHGLGQKPKVIFCKDRDNNRNWSVFHEDVITSDTDILSLNQDIATFTSGTAAWDVSAIDSSTFTPYFRDDFGASYGADNVAYLWCEKSGFSKFGTYTGNGNTSGGGPRVELGFKPAFLLVKGFDVQSGWRVYDSARDSGGQFQKRLYANETSAESTNSTQYVNYDDTGFNVEASGSLSTYNVNSKTYIYMAFAQDPGPEVVDSLLDVPTNGTQTDTGAGGEVSGNYCTLNPLDQRSGTLSDGNLHYDLGSGTKFVSGTIAVKSGKWFWEAKAVSGVTNGTVGGRFAISQTPTETHGENGPFTLVWHATSGIQVFESGSYSTVLTGTNYADGDTLGLALDADANIAYFYKNGSLAYTYDFSSKVAAGSQFLAPSCWNGSSGSPVWTYNFGQRAFAYSARSGHKCLVSTNLSTQTIANGSAHFDTAIWSGNNTDNRTLSIGHTPDWIWIKQRNDTRQHLRQDSVRGFTKVLFNGTEAETTYDPEYSKAATNGIVVNSSGGSNISGRTYVGWAWNAGANSNKTYTVTVVSDSGNKYRFDGHGTSAVTLDLAEGSTYIFDQSDSSNAGHPIRFGTSSNGTDYTAGVTHTGTPGSAGAKTTIVIPAGTIYSDLTSGGAVAGSHPMSQAFDGSTSTAGVRAVSGGGFVFGGSLGISYSSSIRIHSGTSGIGTQQFKLNDGTATDMAENTFVTVASGSGTLNKLEITAGSTGNSNIYLGAVEVDGVILQDNNSTPTLYYSCLNHSGMGGQINTNSTAGSTRLSGSENASAYDQSATWSNVTTLSGGSTASGKPLTNGFDGSTSTLAEGDSANEYAEIAISATIAAGGVRVYAAVTSSNQLAINLYNGSSEVESITQGTSGGQWYSTSSYAGPITKIRVERIGRAWEFNAIEVNGKILVDSNVTPATAVPSTNSVVKANPEAGFSICTFTSPSSGNFTFGHGLNAAPEFVLVKTRGATSDWSVYHASVVDTTSKYLVLNTTAALSTYSTVWGSELPTSSVVGLTSGGAVATSQTCVAYCFAPVAGYSAFGKAVGNNSTDGPFVFTGFKPRFIIWRPTASGHSWMLIDTARDTYNIADATLRAQNSNAESHFDWGDVLSNGFKIRNTDTNPSGVDIIWAAWAENPFQANGGLAR